MLEIQIIKIEDPGCLWARVLKGPGIQPDSPEEYENLRVKMNLFYHEVDLDVQKLKPAELKEGLVCVVFSLALKSWCRAVVESVFQGMVETQAWCLLVDHGDRIIVRADDVRTPLEKFLQLPFRVRRFKLAGIRPMTLQVPISENTADPSSTWDSSATKYLHNLLQGKMSTLVEAVLCETQAGCSAIELYLTINNTKVNCVYMTLFCHPQNTGLLMQFLNPDPLNPDQESLDAKVRFLLWRKYNGPNVAESYCWPAVARGFDTVLVSHSGDNPLSYIPPLLMLLQTVSVVSSLAARTGPTAVILCPGWEKVQTLLELLEDSKATYNLHPTSVLLGVDQEEPKKFKIPRNCQLLVTTPFTMMRLLDAQCFLFLRLCHLVLDEADVLYSQAPEQMSVILKHFQKVVSGEERSSCPRQIIAVGSRWSAGIEALVREHMIYPSVIITVMEEAALYGRVHQRVQLCLDCDKISVLLGSLDFHPPKPQKTLIITNSAEETEHVYKAVVNTAVFTLKAHEDVTDQFDFVIDQWRKDISRGTQVILVTTNDCLKALGIRDATCVVHYGFPSSPKLFGSRLFCMSEHFRNLSDMDHAESSSPAAQSVLLLSELNARHVCGVLRYLRRSGALLPPELLQFALGVQQAKEEQKTDRPLCSSLKSFGFCRDSTVCPDRHMINKSLDHPKHPDSGTVMVLPLCIKSANVYSGRIVSQKDDCYETLAAEMNAHYASERRCAVEVLKGELYAIQEENIYNRVRVMEVPEKGEQLFSSVTACFIDEGRTQEVKSHQLLQLPPQFQDLPGQAVELILCRAQPVDGEVDWNPKVTRAISQKIRGKLHQARVVMSVGNTVWVDPMVRMTRVPGLKTYINEYNVHAEILASGFGVNNPQHLELLKRVFQGDENASTLQHLTDDRFITNTQISLMFESPSSSSQQRVEVIEDVLTSKMRDLVSSHNAMESRQTPISPQNNSAVQCNGVLKDSDDDDSSEGSMNIVRLV
uniref:RNA helicase n=1 Tax=Cyprinus carpio TaxID=7962 RepID=A0A8C1Q9V6_CYPCA